MANKGNSAKQTSIGPPRKVATTGGVVRCISACKRSEQQVEADLAALTRLHDLSTRVLAVDGLRPLFREIVDTAVALVGAERGTLQLLEGDSLRIVAHHGHQPPFLKFFASAETQVSVCGEALKHGERVIVEDVTRSPLFAGTASALVLQAAAVRAVQSTPLRTRAGRLLGILTTQWSVPHVPDELSLWRIDLLARQAADLIEHKQAEEALRKANEELQVRAEQMQTLNDSLWTHQKELETANEDLRAQEQELRSQGEALRDSEERYRALFETAPDAMVVHKDGRFLEANDVALQLTGAGTFEELATHSVLDFFRPEDREPAAERLRAAMAGHRLPMREATLRRLDGQEAVVEFHTAPVDFHGMRAVQTIIRDITERKEGESALRESEARFRTIFDGTTDGMLIADPQSKTFIMGNRAICRMLGCRLEEIPAMQVADIHRPEDLPFVLDHFEKLASGREGTGENIPVRRKDGSIFFADVRANRILLSGKTYVVGSFRDITARKQAEETLRENQTLVHAVMEGSPDLIYMKDLDGRILMVNRATCEMLGRSAKDVIGHDAREFHRDDPEVGRVILENDRRIMESGQMETIEELGSRGRTYLSTKAPYRDATGNIIGLLGISHDITERKRAEESLQRSEGLLRTVIETTADAIYAKDAQSRLVLLNPTALAVVGRPECEILGRDDRGFYDDPAVGEAILENDRRVMASGTVQAFEEKLLTPKGYRYFLDKKAPWRDDKGNVIGIIGVSHDITDEKQAQESLRELAATLEAKVAQRTAELAYRAKQLQKLTLELTQAEERERRRIALILHEDLQQQIAAAKFHLDLLRGRARDDREVGDIDRIAAMLKEAIEKSRGLSRDLSPAVLHMNDLAEALRWLAQRVEAQHGLTVRTDIGEEMVLPSEPMTMFLFRAAQELLSNVVKHARVTQAALRARRMGHYVCLSVSDPGRGFDPQELEETSGWGLLSLRERVELLGGRMRIKSARGQGSRFRLVVPDR